MMVDLPDSPAPVGQVSELHAGGKGSVACICLEGLDILWLNVVCKEDTDQAIIS